MTRDLGKPLGRGAGAASLATILVATLALSGVERLPVLELMLVPGSMAAWLYKGDNYTSGAEFLRYSVAFGLPINAGLGALLGLCAASLARRVRRDR